MSADGHSACISCHAKALKEYDEAAQLVADSYGVVPPARYQEMLIDVVAKQQKTEAFDQRDEGPLAEYFEFYWEGNVLHVEYGANCRVCGFAPEYTATKEFEV